MKKLLVLPILALLFLLSCEKDQAEPVAGFDGQQELITTRANATVPFKGVYTTHPVITEIDPNTGTMTAEIPSEGTATHLGKSTWYSDSQVFNIFIEPPLWDQTGTSIFTAADGSQLIGTFVGTTGPEGDSPFAGSGTYVITSGTGRFEGATGSGTYWYVAAPDLSTAHLEFTGTLTNP